MVVKNNVCRNTPSWAAQARRPSTTPDPNPKAADGSNANNSRDIIPSARRGREVRGPLFNNNRQMGENNFPNGGRTRLVDTMLQCAEINFPSMVVVQN